MFKCLSVHPKHVPPKHVEFSLNLNDIRINNFPKVPQSASNSHFGTKMSVDS
jgi:hypothetical protein